MSNLGGIYAASRIGACFSLQIHLAVPALPARNSTLLHFPYPDRLLRSPPLISVGPSVSSMPQNEDLLGAMLLWLWTRYGFECGPRICWGANLSRSRPH